MRVVVPLALAIVLGLAAVGCSQAEGSGQLDRDVVAVHDDAVDLAKSLEDMVDGGDPILVEECGNDGSGPIGPTTRIDLGLRRSATIDDVRRATETELGRLGYEVVPVEGANLAAGERTLGHDRQAQVRLRQSPSSAGDLVISTALIPPITC
jgi:hypothetical protein